MKRLRGILTNPIIVVLPFVVAALLGWHFYVRLQRHLSIPTGRNLLANGSFDSFQGTRGVPTDWRLQSSGNLRYMTKQDPGYVSGSSFKLAVSNYQSGDVSLTSRKAALRAHKTYLFKGYYYSTMPLDLLARYFYSDGTSRLVQVQQYPNSANTWTTVSDAFATGSNITAVQFMYRAAENGRLQLDGTYLETKQDVAIPQAPRAGPNLIQNGILQAGSITQPKAWLTYHTGDNKAQFSYDRQPHASPFVRVSMSSYRNGEAKWQYEPMHVMPGQAYQFSVSYISSASVDIVAEYVFDNGQRSFDTLATLMPADQWTQVTESLQVPPNAQTMFVSIPLQHNGRLDTADYSLQNITKPGSLRWKRPLVSITFDDGWQSAYDNARPILGEFGYNATFYVNPSTIETKDFMTGAELKNLSKWGDEIAAHGYAHLDMTALDDAKLAYELREGRNYLRKAGFPVNDFAVPYGRTDAEVRWYAQHYFALLRGTDTGVNTRQNLDPYDLEVLYFEANTPDKTIRDALRETAASDGWLILVYHQVGPETKSPVAADAGGIDIPTPTFIRQMQIVHNSGIAVKTVDQAYNEIKPQR